MCKALADKMNMDPKKMMPALAAASGNIKIMS
jgi:hypothetical protein